MYSTIEEMKVRLADLQAYIYPTEGNLKRQAWLKAAIAKHENKEPTSC